MNSPISQILKHLLLIFLLTVSDVLVAGDEFRSFTNTQGKTIRAKVKALQSGKVVILLDTGKEFTVQVTTFSAADQEYLKKWQAAAAASAALNPTSGVTTTAINEVIGHELFADKMLWDSSPEEVANRLKWSKESKTEFSESYRSYPREDYRFLGARPFSTALYGSEGKVNGVSIVFANKGDSFGSRGGGEEHFIKGNPVPGGMKGLKIIMENDAEIISSELTKQLGEAERQKFGEGESRVNVQRWDWGGHAFLLSNVEDEYVSLSIQTIEFANDRGKSSRVPDSVVRKRIRGNVESRENGDVVINDIPMVDQGPKGYCVPATVERCMRFLGMSADMYLLAMAGQTKAGGGTSVDLLLSNIGRDIKRKGRSFESNSGELKMRDIKKSINDGVPIIWALFSTSEFNNTANERSKERKEKDWAGYKKEVFASAKTNNLPPDPSKGHVVIIIGYNEETQELAFSDSWGERYRERWITISEAEQISQKRFYIIDL